MKKRGQIELSFVFIMAIIIGLIAIAFGYIYIPRLLDSSEDIALAKWEQNFNDKVSEMFFLDTGSTDFFKVSLPKRITHVCIRSGEVTDFPSFIDARDRSMLRADLSKNVIFIPSDSFKSNTFFLVENLNGSTSFVCIPNNQDIILESKGTYVEGGSRYSS
ncbi:MAG: hypothetical protein AABW49_00550 [Nanoarchaeota archaeon]